VEEKFHFLLAGTLFKNREFAGEDVKCFLQKHRVFSGKLFEKFGSQ